MAATRTVPQRLPLRKHSSTPEIAHSAISPRNGVVTLWGYGIKIRVDRGHLILEDGIGDQRREGRFPRVSHGLERLVVIGNDGMVSLAALRWFADQGSAFVMLERDGSVLLTTGPARSADASLKRAQGRANDTGAAIEISRALIHQKLAAQEQLAREALRDSIAANQVAEFRAGLAGAATLDEIRLLEAKGAAAYWNAWRQVRVDFPRRDLHRVPQHWQVFGTRKSPLTGSPRHAATPACAMLNYAYALLEFEARLAAVAVGLDPGLGFLHVDAGSRDSFVYDLMEPVRPQVDAYVLDWLRREPLKREWFFEHRDGGCRLMVEFAARLGETVSTWRQAVAPYAEWVVHALLTIGSDAPRTAPTPLTRRNFREARGLAPLPRNKPAPKPDGVCRICGISVAAGKSLCRVCQITFATEQITKASAERSDCHVSPVAQAQRSETKRLNDRAVKNWNPANQPDWLTLETYNTKIQPRLAAIRPTEIMRAIGVSWMYASYIRRGIKRPHPRHWVKLAELVGIK